MNGDHEADGVALRDMLLFGDDFDVERAATLLKVLGNLDRLRILNLLAEGARSVAEIEAALGISQPLVSQALQRLRQDKIVDFRKSGKFVIYSIADESVLPILGEIKRRFAASRG